jgi:hypothetical protein
VQQLYCIATAGYVFEQEPGMRCQYEAREGPWVGMMKMSMSLPS